MFELVNQSERRIISGKGLQSCDEQARTSLPQVLERNAATVMKSDRPCAEANAMCVE